MSANGNQWANRIIGHGVKPADQFQAHPQNWRTHPEHQRMAVKTSLDTLGWIDTVIENVTTGNLVDGHERVWQALVNNDDVPYIQVELTEAEEKLALATLDPISAMATADRAMLSEMLAELKAEPVYQEPNVDALLARVADDVGVKLTGEPAEDAGPQVDRAAELQEQWQTARGQVWEVPSKSVPGRCHRVMCGDSTSAEDVARLMAGEKAALLASDPPYNVAVDYGEHTDDSKTESDYEQFSCSWFGLWSAVSERQIVTPGCNNLARWCRYFEPYHAAPWTKLAAMTNGKVSRFWAWEPMLFFGIQWKRSRPNDVFHYEALPQSMDSIGTLTGVHPCPKPLKMWIDLLENYSEQCELVLDAFLGSGTTAVAAEQTARICYGMEIAPEYTAVILQRLADLGLEPRLVEDATA